MSRFDAGRGGSSGALAIWRDAVFRAGRCSVEVCDLAGEVRDTVPLDESHGHVCKMDANGEFLAVTTSGNYLRMWRPEEESQGARPVSGRSRRRARRARRCDHRVRAGEPRRHARERTLRRAGSSAALPQIVVYDLDADAFRSFDFSPAGRPGEPRVGRGSHLAPRRANVQGAGRTVPVHSARRERCRGCRGCRGKIRRRRRVAFGSDVARFGPLARRGRPVVVYTLFAARDDIVLQESHSIPAGFESLLGVAVPSLFVCRKSALEEGGGVCFSVTMRDFLGMERADAETRAALLDFNYNLAVGNSDAAFAAVKTIKNPDVWENMAHMCIKNKRLDVAETCLGNMGHVRGARRREGRRRGARARRARRRGGGAPGFNGRGGTPVPRVRSTRSAQPAVSSVRAVERRGGAGVQARSHPPQDDALQPRQTPRVRGRSPRRDSRVRTRWVRVRGGAEAAALPRANGGARAIRASAADAKLTKWWARFCESVGDLERALDAYQAAGDHLSLVRVYCSRGAFDDAARLVEESGDPAAAFHLARTYEARDDVREAVTFSASPVGTATRLASRARRGWTPN